MCREALNGMAVASNIFNYEPAGTIPASSF